MKLINAICPSCGATLQVDRDKKNPTCTYCGGELIIDDDDYNPSNSSQSKIKNNPQKEMRGLSYFLSKSRAVTKIAIFGYG